MSLAMKTPMDLVISACLVDDREYLFLRPSASGRRSCPVNGCLTFSRFALFVLDNVIPCLRSKCAVIDDVLPDNYFICVLQMLQTVKVLCSVPSSKKSQTADFLAAIFCLFCLSVVIL